MTVVRLSSGRDGTFLSCRAEGHAGFAVKGADIVCSAVTVLLRTALQILSDTEGIELQADGLTRGELSFSIRAENFDGQLQARLICIRDFIRQGIRSLTDEYPGYVALLEHTEE